MNEAEFIASIDCAFPYGNPIRWRRLSASAARISANAAFTVLHEICRVPRSRTDLVSESQRRAMVSHLRRRFRHAVLRTIEPAVAAFLAGKTLRPMAAAALMRKLAAHPGQYSALDICYFSADERQGATHVERAYERTVQAWTAGNSAQAA